MEELIGKAEWNNVECNRQDVNSQGWYYDKDWDIVGVSKSYIDYYEMLGGVF